MAEALVTAVLFLMLVGLVIGAAWLVRHAPDDVDHGTPSSDQAVDSARAEAKDFDQFLGGA